VSVLLAVGAFTPVPPPRAVELLPLADAASPHANALVPVAVELDTGSQTKACAVELERTTKAKADVEVSNLNFILYSLESNTFLGTLINFISF
jgi:hypothetical protein